MGLGDWLLGAGSSPTAPQTQAEADANYAAQQAQFNAALAQRQSGSNPITDPSLLENYTANTTGTLDSQNTGAVVGALQGATEIFYNPSQWWADTVSGGQIVATGVKGVIANLAKSIPWWAWLTGAGAIFLWLGGFNLIAILLAFDAGKRSK